MKEKASSVKLPCDPHIGAGAKKLREKAALLVKPGSRRSETR
jgi:hypothetical protein